ncbi:hypothetical protein LOD99_1327 [Oopsacas minuta]|uniref:Phosphatidylinositol 3,4,5-trisphosphate 3-phosphatase and dual-specificity protein phosphatase PTEN n=1 Tax=Oopsacas minuta TaxID=111878 RepID=A0AAV7K8G5_9METZ|nr:hypothetical protein LOD99_1327 [Oopsacas minuta]
MSVIKHFVSKKKRRFQQNGFDLDLTYITDNIVAMGYPSEKLEGFVRNKADDVIRFFDTYHPDSYKVYNLCSERKYDPSKFHNRVAEYPFEDHNAPRFEVLKPCCEDISDWLSHNHERNVVAIHCKAGKGRTGVIICSYLLHCGSFTDTKEALQFYGERRTQNAKGVTIPSQRRYVYYYNHMLRKGLTYTHTPLLLKSITLVGIPAISAGVCTPMFIVRQGQGAKIYQSEPFQDVKKTDKEINIVLPKPLPICGDLRIEFVHVSKMSNEKMFQYWFNTFFIFHSCPTEEQELLEATFTHSVPPTIQEIPDKHTAKQHKKANQGPLQDDSTVSLPLPISPSANSIGSDDKDICCSSDVASASVGIGLTKRVRHRGGSIRRSMSEIPIEAINPMYCDEFHLNLPKWELDRAHKDKDSKQYPDTFRVITSITNPLSQDERYEVDADAATNKRHELVDYCSDLSEDDDDDDVRDGSEVMGIPLKKKDFSGNSHSKPVSKTSVNNNNKHEGKPKISSKTPKASSRSHINNNTDHKMDKRSHSNAISSPSPTEVNSSISSPNDLQSPTSPEKTNPTFTSASSKNNSSHPGPYPTKSNPSSPTTPLSPKFEGLAANSPHPGDQRLSESTF